MKTQFFRQLFILDECLTIVHIGPCECQAGLIILTEVAVLSRLELFNQSTNFFPSNVRASLATRIFEFLYAYQACLIFILGGEISVNLFPFVS